MNPRYLALLQMYQGRDLVTMSLFVFAFGIMFTRYVIETSPLAFVKRSKGKWIASFWTIVLLVYLSFFVFICCIWMPPT